MTVKCTRLCYWIARPAKPGVQSSNTSRVHFTVISHTPMCILAFITHILCINGIEITFVWLIQYTLRYIFFKFTILFASLHWWILVKHAIWRDTTWWQCGAQCCCYVVTIVTAGSSIMTSCTLNMYCDVTQCMTGLWIFITKLESPKGDSQT